MILFIIMSEVLNKKNELIGSIKNSHVSSSYSSNPLPKLIAVSKQQPDYKIIQALEAGQRVFGENKLQDAIKRWSNYLNSYNDLELHYIGHLQSNKVKKALNFFDAIHTIDRENLAIEISKYLTSGIKTKFFMIQINTGNEESKSGINLKHFEDFFYFTKNLKIPVKGLMCIPPINESPSIHFSLLKEIASKYKIKYLSMGMSTDFEQAIKFGSTHVRIGSSFFGKRI